eukprot:scaffold1085_cov252-Pinguiococcus_pyrenoidosus.AAC.5
MDPHNMRSADHQEALRQILSAQYSSHSQRTVSKDFWSCSAMLWPNTGERCAPPALASPALARRCTMILRVVLSFGLVSYSALSAPVNRDVMRILDATSAVVKQRVDVTVDEVGSSGYDYVVPAPASEHLAFIFAKQLKGAELSVTLKRSDATGKTFTIHSPEGSVVLRIRTVFTRMLTPLPASIRQGDDQFVVLEDSHYFLSPYPTTSQTLTVKLDGAGKSEIVDYTQLEPSTLKNKGGAIVFGPYGDVAAMASSPMRVHFLNNAPFATFTDVLREIEVGSSSRSGSRRRGILPVRMVAHAPPFLATLRPTGVALGQYCCRGAF